jgi:hypothetical protein
MLTGAGLGRAWHHSRAHRLFANARWSSNALGLALADLIVARLLPADSALTVAGEVGVTTLPDGERPGGVDGWALPPDSGHGVVD